MAGLTFAPNFSQANAAASFPTETLNYILENKTVDRFSFYQTAFGCYHFMRLTSNLTHRIYFPKSSPFVWQALDSCSWTPNGALSFGDIEIQPCKAKLNEQHCYDSMFDSCFEHFLSYTGNGPLRLTTEGMRLTQVMLRELMKGMILGGRLLLTAGKLYDYSKIKDHFKAEATGETKKMIERSIGTCRGWVELAREMALAKYPWMNCADIIIEDDFDGDAFVGDILAVVDKIYDKRTADLCELTDMGGISDISDGNMGMPLWKMSTSYIKNLAKRFREECADPLCKNPRITREEVSAAGRMMKVYFIDDIPVVPVADLNCYDKYLNGATHLIVLTVSGNIQLGVSAGKLPSLPASNADIGMRIQLSEDNETYGKYTFLAHALFSAAIANPQLFVGAQKFISYS